MSPIAELLVVSDYVKGHWVALCHLVGLVMEIWGTTLMARRYIATTDQPLLVLFAAIRRGGKAQRAAYVGGQLKKEKGIDILQGLSFLMAGFLLRTLPAIVELFD